MGFRVSSMCVVFVALESYVSSVQATCLTSCSVNLVKADCSDADIAKDPCEGIENCLSSVTWAWPSNDYPRVAVECSTACCAPPFEGQEPGDNCDNQEHDAAETIAHVEQDGNMGVTDADQNDMGGAFASTGTVCGERGAVFLYDKIISAPGSYHVVLDNIANSAYFDVFDAGDGAASGTADSGCALAGNAAPMAPTALWLLLALAGVFWVQRRRLN